METGYDLHRVRHLAAQVEASIGALGGCRCDDPLAAEARWAVGATVRTLEEMWMPLLREIERSTAMTVGLTTAVGAHGTFGPDWRWRTPSLPWSVRSISPAASRLIALLQWPPEVGDVRPPPLGSEVAHAIELVLGDAQACLDVLRDPKALDMLAHWNRVPDDLVQQLVTNGLYHAIVEQPDRLTEGYSVLARVIELTNGDLDDGGLRAGFARGVAVSLSGFVTTLAPALRHEGDYPVHVIDDATGVDVLLGTYDDVADLFGALLRDEQAQAALGLVLGGYAARVVDQLGADLTSAPGLGDVAAITDLVSDAARAERAEMVAAAAAAAARWRWIGDTIGFGVEAAVAAAGAGPAVRGLADWAAQMAVEHLAQPSPSRLGEQSIAAEVHDVVIVTTATMVMERPELREPLGLESMSDGQWSVLGDHIADLEAAASTEEHRHQLARLEQWIDTNAAPLAALLTTVRAAPGMHELTESRDDPDPDD